MQVPLNTRLDLSFNPASAKQLPIAYAEVTLMIVTVQFCFANTWSLYLCVVSDRQASRDRTRHVNLMMYVHQMVLYVVVHQCLAC